MCAFRGTRKECEAFMKKASYLLLFLIFLFMTGCTQVFTSTKEKHLKFYNNDENFIVLTGEVVDAKYTYHTEEHTYHTQWIHIQCDEIDKFISDEEFKYLYSIFAPTTIDINAGDTITFTTCKKNLQDSEWLPIIEIYKNEECLLDYKTGKELLIAWVNQLQYK